jgi:predicted enzyme related to lactoylglutathione lyase
MTDGRHRQPAGDETPHAVPKDAAILATPQQRAIPEASHLEPKEKQRRLVHGHSVVADVSTHHCLQPRAQFRDGFVHAPLKLDFPLVQLRLQPFTYRLPQHRKPSVAPLLYADVRKAEEVERLGLPFSTPLPVVDRIRTELQKSRLLRMQFQVELPHSFGKFRPKLIGIPFAVEAHHDVIGKSHHDHIAVRATPPLRVAPHDSGRCGSLVHIRMIFTFTTPRRFSRRTRRNEMKIKVTSVYVDDQSQALRFYTEVLGFAKKTDFSQGPYRWLTVASPEEPDGTELQLALNDNPAAKAYQQAIFQQGQPAAMFFTDDVKGDYERIKARGAVFTMPPTAVTGSTIAMLKDTCGNLIQLTQLARDSA